MGASRAGRAQARCSRRNADEPPIRGLLALKALAARGVRAKELIPSFPSLTFPNHYTMVTGLYPAHHGIVSNTVADPTFPERFRMSSPTVRNARWWGGEPIWVTAIRQNRIAMDMFWPGSEAPIGGVSPTRWWPFDGTVPNEERVTRVLDWLALPPSISIPRWGSPRLSLPFRARCAVWHTDYAS